jgi:hypothetical protein
VVLMKGTMHYWGWVDSPFSLDPAEKAHWFMGSAWETDTGAEEIEQWCFEQFGSEGWRRMGSIFWKFDDDTDAMAFRLRWC